MYLSIVSPKRRLQQSLFNEEGEKCLINLALWRRENPTHETTLVVIPEAPPNLSEVLPDTLNPIGPTFSGQSHL